MAALRIKLARKQFDKEELDEEIEEASSKVDILQAEWRKKAAEWKE
jgi:hypothetical protein